MAKTPSEESRAKRPESQQATMHFDPSGALTSFEPLFHASNKWLEGWIALSSELMEFSKSRFDRSMEVGKAMARSGSLDQAMDLQADYARSLVRDYLNEASKLADLGTRALLDGFWAWQPAAREAMHRTAAE